jgi:hypothetical protein
LRLAQIGQIARQRFALRRDAAMAVSTRSTSAANTTVAACWCTACIQAVPHWTFRHLAEGGGGPELLLEQI